MTRSPRRYSNAWREQQAAQTRESILHAVVQVLAGGLADLSVPAIARAAGLSVRTIYRHFPTKRDLLIALGEHMDRRSGYGFDPLPRRPEDLDQTVRDAYRQADALSVEHQAARPMSSGIWCTWSRSLSAATRYFGSKLIWVSPQTRQRRPSSGHCTHCYRRWPGMHPSTVRSTGM